MSVSEPVRIMKDSQNNAQCLIALVKAMTGDMTT